MSAHEASLQGCERANSFPSAALDAGNVVGGICARPRLSGIGTGSAAPFSLRS